MGLKDNIETNGTNTDIMTLADAAGYLKIAEKTLLRMIHRNEIPAAKVGNQYRFVKTVIEDWLIAKMNVLPAGDMAKLIESRGDLLEIWRLFDEGLMVLKMSAGHRDAALIELTRPLVDTGLVRDGAAFTKKLIEREDLLSTAVEDGIALPHLRRPWETPFGRPVIVFGRHPGGIDFGGPGGEKTSLFFLLCTDSEVVHLRALKELAGVLADKETIAALGAAVTETDIIACIHQAERKKNKK